MSEPSVPVIGVNAVNILNVTDVDPVQLALWSSQHLMSVRIPEPGPNRSLSTLAAEIATLVAALPNRQALATELHAVVTGSLANQRIAKRLDKTSDIENTITALTASQEILYRAIQALQSMIDSCKALNITGNAQVRMGG